MKTEIFIENKRLDLTSDISSLLSFALDDIKDFASRNTMFSKTIVLPGTANNNLLFGNIFDVKISNPYDSGSDNVATNFNASVSARFLMFNDHLQVCKGTLRLLEIIISDGVPEYEVAVFGELAGLVASIGSSKLEDLNFSEYNTVWTDTQIAASWDNPPGSGVYFPSNIDYGTYSDNKHDWDFRGMRPAFYVKEYIDKIFEAAGYSYESDIFQTDRFKRLVVPNNSRQLLKVSDFSFYVDAPAHSYDGITDPLDKVVFSTVIIGTGFTPDGTFTEWTATGIVNGVLQANVNGSFTKTLGSTLRFSFMKNGIEMQGENFGVGQTTGTFNIVLAANSVINSGDIVWVEFSGPATYTLDLDDGQIKVLFTTLIEVTLGDLIDMNLALPKNILQKDFLSSVIRLFNLYLYEDRDYEKRIFIAPYVDFFDLNVSGVVDWNYKMDRSKTVRLRPMSELNARYYVFNFKDDSDFYNDLYKKRYNQTYGSRIYDSAFEFANESNKVPLIFSGTPLVGYAGEDKIYSTMFKMNSGVEDNMDTNIRILQTKNVSGVSSWSIMDGTATLNSYTKYGYAGHYNDPDAPANDIQFGVPSELFFTLVSGSINITQFNVYWSAYMAEITDKDSKLLTAWFKLTNKDIYDLNFSKFIYVDGSFWRLNKITDWNASEPDVCQCELLKVINMIY